jgi:hypothetical protein
MLFFAFFTQKMAWQIVSGSIIFFADDEPIW